MTDWDLSTHTPVTSCTCDDDSLMPSSLRPISLMLLTGFALIAFAGNSLLCRLALRDGLLAPDQFTLLRLASGALFFLLLMAGSARFRPDGFWQQILSLKHSLGGLLLFLYALFFSWAYVLMNAATGALVLFVTVQLTMTLAGLVRGQRGNAIFWSGFVLATAGFAALLLPGYSQTDSLSLQFMSIAGLAWAGYSLLGLGSQDPMTETAINFVATLPWCLLLLILMMTAFSAEDNGAAAAMSNTGIALALTSGIITSALGYSLWYAALKGLSTLQAGVSQLAVPALTAVGGVLFLGEQLSLYLVGCIVLTLLGICMVIMARSGAPG